MKKLSFKTSRVKLISGIYLVAMVILVTVLTGAWRGGSYVGLLMIFFGFIGGALIIDSVVHMVKVVKYNKLLDDDTAFITEATFISNKYLGPVIDKKSFGKKQEIYHVELESIKYSYKDERGVMHFVNSLEPFTPSQVDYLKDKGKFKIKCRGANNAIIEEILVPEKNIDTRKPE